MTATLTRPADLDVLDSLDVAGDLGAELAQQQIGQEVAVLTGMPGLSTVHCLTVSADEEYLPTM
ncbi:hypothetical protein RDV89_08680 [Nocardioides zeae]|uniref:Uncharacterized protein n=1 Tax=Nocardioides imazamoxiresistens TaxID=3231893 RepID=A0ABU3PV79_9ACTN|nr:hypothetical protein [Nocardioides zeae]MDT9593141.1 hypothetical protein [Nocardioides zeae]